MNNTAKKLNEYDQQAEEFIKETGLDMSIVFIATMPHFTDDDQERDVYQITLKTSRGVYSFRYGDSIVNTYRHALKTGRGIPESTELLRTFAPFKRGLTIHELSEIKRKEAQQWEKPNAYSVIQTAFHLACLGGYPVGTFADFCANYGSDEDSRQAFKTYEAMLDEESGLTRVFTPEQLELLQEIN